MAGSEKFIVNLTTHVKVFYLQGSHKRSKSVTKQPRTRTRALKFLTILFFIYKTAKGWKYLFSSAKKNIFFSSSLERALQRNARLALVTHKYPHSLRNLHSTKEKHYVTGNATISATHCYHGRIWRRCSRKWRDNHKCKKVFTRWMRLLSWREGWSALLAIFGETHVVQCKQNA